MDAALHELPLAIFTTLAPIGAGAFLTLAIAFATTSFTEAQQKAIDKFTALPLVLILVGMGCSFAHLANPANVMNVASTLGSSPLANEMLALGVFCLAALIYWIMALTGKLQGSARSIFSIVVAALGLIFALFVGFAYAIPTIISWDTPVTPIMMIALAVFGGSILGLLVLAMGGAAEDAMKGEAGKISFIVLAAAAIISVICILAFFFTATGSHQYYTALVGSGDVMAPLILSIVFAIIAFAAGAFAMKMVPTKALCWIALIAVIIAVLCARLVFYGLQIGIGL